MGELATATSETSVFDAMRGMPGRLSGALALAGGVLGFAAANARARIIDTKSTVTPIEFIHSGHTDAFGPNPTNVLAADIVAATVQPPAEASNLATASVDLLNNGEHITGACFSPTDTHLEDYTLSGSIDSATNCDGTPAMAPGPSEVSTFPGVLTAERNKIAAALGLAVGNTTSVDLQAPVEFQAITTQPNTQSPYAMLRTGCVPTSDPNAAHNIATTVIDGQGNYQTTKCPVDQPANPNGSPVVSVAKSTLPGNTVSFQVGNLDSSFQSTVSVVSKSKDLKSQTSNPPMQENFTLTSQPRRGTQECATLLVKMVKVNSGYTREDDFIDQSCTRIAPKPKPINPGRLFSQTINGFSGKYGASFIMNTFQQKLRGNHLILKGSCRAIGIILPDTKLIDDGPKTQTFGDCNGSVLSIPRRKLAPQLRHVNNTALLNQESEAVTLPVSVADNQHGRPAYLNVTSNEIVLGFFGRTRAQAASGTRPIRKIIERFYKGHMTVQKI